MKTIILILMLTALNFGQNNLLTLFNDGISYDTDAQTYFDAMTTPLSKGQKDRINTFVLMLKDSLAITNLSDKFDVLYLFANETSEAGLKNLVARSNDATQSATPTTFTEWEGFNGNGTSSYLNTNYDFSATNTYERNSAHISIYQRDADITASANGQLLGATFSTTFSLVLYVVVIGDTWSYYVMNDVTNLSHVSNPPTLGLLAIDRPNATTLYAYRNGVETTHGTANSVALPLPINLYIFADNYWNGSIFASRRWLNAQAAIFTLGASLGVDGQRQLKNCQEWYMDDLNKGVIP